MSHTVSYSELDTIRQCRLKHHLAYKERWRSSGDTPPALSRGSLFHKIMEAHYLMLRSRYRTQTAIDELIDPLSYLADDDESELVRWMYDGYRDVYGDDTSWEILAVELRVERWLLTDAGRLSRFKLKGIIDLLVRDNSAGGGLWIIDHKTCRTLPKDKDFDLDDQFGLYTYLLRRPNTIQGLELAPGLAREDGSLDIRGVIHNAVRTERLKREMQPSERFARTLTTRTDTELKIIASEALDTFEEGYREGPSSTLRGGLPPRSPNPDTCKWRCGYTEPCLSSRKGQDIHGLLEDYGYVVDPLRH